MACLMTRDMPFLRVHLFAYEVSSPLSEVADFFLRHVRSLHGVEGYCIPFGYLGLHRVTRMFTHDSLHHWF